jgi:2C-methyl-D-erythritol 2,4-cyclodiphosphate synthase
MTATQAMLACFLQDMKQFFKSSQLLNEDKTYARILKVAETTQKCMPHFYSISNVALKLICTLR